MKNQIRLTQSAIQNFNSTIKKLNENEKLILKNFKIIDTFINNTDASLPLINLKSTVNTHFITLSSLSEEIYENIEMLLNSILIAKQNVLLPYIITPRQVYTE